MQERHRIVNNILESYLKPRVTFHLSYGVRERSGQPDFDEAAGTRWVAPPVNGSVPVSHKSVAYPTVQQIGENIAILDWALSDEEGVDVEAAVVDITNAYSFLLQQRLDWWLQCFSWHGGIRFSLRVVFGGAWGPACFMERVAVPRAVVTRDINKFDAQQPPPASMLAKLQARKQLQQQGVLPEGLEEGQAHISLTFFTARL